MTRIGVYVINLDRLPERWQTISTHARQCGITLIRVSAFRELDSERSTESNPVLAMRREMRLKPGEIVPVTIALSPMSILFRQGEEMELTVSGFRFPPFIPLAFGEAKVPFPVDGLTFPPDQPAPINNFFGSKEDSASKLAPAVPPTRNEGRHIIHVGGRYTRVCQR